MTPEQPDSRPLPTLEAVAALAGVSRTTVSRVVNASTTVTPEFMVISSKTRPDKTRRFLMSGNVDDHMAAGAYAAILEAGLRIPDDIAVVGFDDDYYATTAAPPVDIGSELSAGTSHGHGHAAAC